MWGIKPWTETLASPRGLQQNSRLKLSGSEDMWQTPPFAAFIAAGHLSLLPRQKNIQTTPAKMEQGKSPFVFGWFSRGIKIQTWLVWLRCRVSKKWMENGMELCYKTTHCGLPSPYRVYSKRESVQQNLPDIFNGQWSLEPFSLGGQLTSHFMEGENGHSWFQA